MLLSVKSKRLLTGSASKGSAASSTRKGRPCAKPSSRKERSKLMLEMSKSVSRRRRDSATLVKREKLAGLKKLPSALLKKKPKVKMTMARTTRTRMVKATLTTKMMLRTRSRNRLLVCKSLARALIRMMAPRMMIIKRKLKRLKLINLKRILEKTPESMQIPIKLKEMAEVAKSVKEVAGRKVEVAVVDVDVRTRI